MVWCPNRTARPHRGHTSMALPDENRISFSTIPPEGIFSLGFMCFFATLVSVGVLFRGPGQNWVYPWKDGLFYLRNLNPLGEHGFEL